MKIERETLRTDGRRRVVVILEPDEKIRPVRINAYYKLGFPVEGVVPGHVIDDAALMTLTHNAGGNSAGTALSCQSGAAQRSES